MLQHHLEQAIEDIGRALRSIPFGDRIKYSNWLAQTYFYVAHTSHFLKLLEKIYHDQNDEANLRHTLEHQREEAGHEKLLLSDLKFLGFKISEFEELPFTKALYNYQYYWLTRRFSSSAHLAYSLLFEGVAAQFGSELLAITKKKHGKGSSHFIEVHAKADQNHYADGLTQLHQLSGAEAKDFLESLNITKVLYLKILAAVRLMDTSSITSEILMRVDSPTDTVGTIINMIQREQHSVPRVPEDTEITANPNSVAEYAQVASTNMMANYCVTMDYIYRTMNEPGQGTCIDLASGPGLLAKELVKQGLVTSLSGYDLSPLMVHTANSNPVAGTEFRLGDVRKLKVNQQADLVTFCNSAHHLDSINDVSKVLTSAEKICKDDGIVLLTDLARIPNEKAMQAFTSFAGSEFIHRKMFWMYEDFRRSLMAAWTADELMSAIPQRTDRIWYHTILSDLPFFQILIGVNKNRQSLFLREPYPWETKGLLKSQEAMGGFMLMKELLSRSEPRRYHQPAKKIAA